MSFRSDFQTKAQRAAAAEQRQQHLRRQQAAASAPRSPTGPPPSMRAARAATLHRVLTAPLTRVHNDPSQMTRTRTALTPTARERRENPEQTSLRGRLDRMSTVNTSVRKTLDDIRKSVPSPGWFSADKAKLVKLTKAKSELDELHQNVIHTIIKEQDEMNEQGRLNPGVSEEQALTTLNTLASEIVNVTQNVTGRISKHPTRSKNATESIARTKREREEYIGDADLGGGRRRKATRRRRSRKASKTRSNKKARNNKSRATRLTKSRSPNRRTRHRNR